MKETTQKLIDEVNALKKEIIVQIVNGGFDTEGICALTRAFNAMDLCEKLMMEWSETMDNQTHKLDRLLSIAETKGL